MRRSVRLQMIKVPASKIKEIKYDGKNLLFISTGFFDIVIAVSGNPSTIKSVLALRENKCMTICATMGINKIEVRLNDGPVPKSVSMEDFKFMYASTKIRISTNEILMHSEFYGEIIDPTLSISLKEENGELVTILK